MSRASRARAHDLAALADHVAQWARWAAAHEQQSVVCPPIATFMTDRSAAMDNMANGVAISVDVDEADPRESRRVLTGLLGEPTVVVQTGSVWVDPRTGKSVPKIHMHWRLSEPTTTPAEHARLRGARRLAAVRVGADRGLAPPVHPIRGPGSLNRKASPALAVIETIDADRVA